MTAAALGGQGDPAGIDGGGGSDAETISITGGTGAVQSYTGRSAGPGAGVSGGSFTGPHGPYDERARLAHGESLRVVGGEGENRKWGNALSFSGLTGESIASEGWGKGGRKRQLRSSVGAKRST
ncbi:MAG: hypothetical protein MdMp014T_2162 [Treponematales bacterium]